MTDLFERASRNKFRFASLKGDLTAEQLWDLPLQAKSGFDLDTVAKTINNALKAAAEESFVTPTVTTGARELEAKLDLVKHVIATKQAENAERRRVSERASERQILIDLLDKKRTDALNDLSEEQIQARLAELESAA